MTTEREKIIQLARECRIYHRDTPKGTEEMWCFETDLIDFYHAAQAEAFEADAKLCDENACDYTREGAEVCAAAIRKRAKEKQNA